MSRAVFEFNGTLSQDQWSHIQDKVQAYMHDSGHATVALLKAEARLDAKSFTRVALSSSSEWGVDAVLDIICQLLRDDAVVEYWHGKL